MVCERHTLIPPSADGGNSIPTYGYWGRCALIHHRKGLDISIPAPSIVTPSPCAGACPHNQTASSGWPAQKRRQNRDTEPCPGRRCYPPVSALGAATTGHETALRNSEFADRWLVDLPSRNPELPALSPLVAASLTNRICMPLPLADGTSIRCIPGLFHPGLCTVHSTCSHG